ncbi:MAG: insulinase family protein, partial [Bacteroidota bacterium]
LFFTSASASLPVELMKEITQYVGDKPATETEFNKVRGNSILELPGSWETNNAVLGSLQSAVKYERGLVYLNTYAAMLQNMKLADIQNAAKRVIQPNGLTWVIVGDRSKIEKGIQELNIGAIKYIDSEGKEIK